MTKCHGAANAPSKRELLGELAPSGSDAEHADASKTLQKAKKIRPLRDLKTLWNALDGAASMVDDSLA